jgi:hypothetical protein
LGVALSAAGVVFDSQRKERLCLLVARDLLTLAALGMIVHER